jgi:hypothetical protein
LLLKWEPWQTLFARCGGYHDLWLLLKYPPYHFHY